MASWLGSLAATGGDEEHGLLALLDVAEQLSGSGAWAWFVDSDQIRWSPNMYRILGLDPAADRPSLEGTVGHTHPGDRARLQDALARARDGDPDPEIHYRVITAGGTVKLLHAVMAAEMTPDRGMVLVGWLQDLTMARTAEREIAAHIAVATALAAWDEEPRPAQHLLRELGVALGFSHAILWVPQDGVLAPRSAWRLDDEPFDVSTVRLRPGQGLAGRAWEAAEPMAIASAASDDGYGFRQEARQQNLHGALAIPVLSAGEVIAVIGLAGSDPLEFTDRLRATLTGIGHEVGARLAGRRAQLTDSALSGRELEVLQLAADGHAGPEIASRLTISPATVKTHFENIYAKYEVPDRVAAVAKALRQGLIR